MFNYAFFIRRNTQIHTTFGGNPNIRNITNTTKEIQKSKSQIIDDFTMSAKKTPNLKSKAHTLSNSQTPQTP